MSSVSQIRWVSGGDNVEEPEETLVCVFPDNEDEDGPLPCGCEEWVVVRNVESPDSVSLMLMCTECETRVGISAIYEAEAGLPE